MNIKQVESLYNACHDYGTIIAGEFPTLDAVIDAHAEGRLLAKDNIEDGSLKIVGRDECHIEFDINEGY